MPTGRQGPYPYRRESPAPTSLQGRHNKGAGHRRGDLGLALRTERLGAEHLLKAGVGPGASANLQEFLCLISKQGEVRLERRRCAWLSLVNPLSSGNRSKADYLVLQRRDASTGNVTGGRIAENNFDTFCCRASMRTAGNQHYVLQDRALAPWHGSTAAPLFNRALPMPSSGHRKALSGPRSATTT